MDTNELAKAQNVITKKLDKDRVLKVSKKQQFFAVDELIEKSTPSTVYYFMLLLSSVIIAAGLLLGNLPIVIGGMLVTPVLTPVLVIALGISAGEIGIIKRTSILVLKSSLFVIIGSAIITIFFGQPPEGSLFVDNSLRTAILYFIVATASGVAVTFAWIRRESSEVVPGIAIAVSLVPPLALIGIKLVGLDLQLAQFYFVVFIFNLLGIIVGSLVVFSLSKFHQSYDEIKEKNEEVIVQEHLKKLSKEL